MLRKKFLVLMALSVFGFCGAMDDPARDLLSEMPKTVSLLNNKFIFSLLDSNSAKEVCAKSFECDCADKYNRGIEAGACGVIYKLEIPNCIFGDCASVFILINITHKDSFLEFSGVSCFRYLDEIHSVYHLTLGALTISLFESQISEFIPYYLGRMLLQAFLFFELVDPKNFKHEFNKKIYEDFSAEGMLCCNLVILPCLHCFDVDKISRLSTCPVCIAPFSMESALVYYHKDKKPFYPSVRDLILSKNLHRPAGWARLKNIF